MIWKRWGAALDRLPSKAGLPVGIGVGAVAGALLLLAPTAVWVPAFLVLMVAAGILAWSGESIEASPAAFREAGAGFEMVSISAGMFLMGSLEKEKGRYDDEGPAHEVGISAFLCMKTPVTRGLYADVMGADPGWPKGGTDNCPINNVSWFDAVEFCNRLSKREGLAPCYERAGRKVIWLREADGYRLPTEAEWEYACRAGTQTRWSFGDDEGRLADHAWYIGNTKDKKPQRVGQKRPNPWGLHDMHGNIREWCWDWLGPYEPAFAQDPAGLDGGPGRLVRGGSYLNTAWFLRSAIRFRYEPKVRDKFIGFRCVRVQRQVVR